ncbi:MAG: hypothetical protein A2471_01895 [Omnitrophica WOR_2 bacterium RIFOXYC2_FULL_45_15]|nr:MAG: hypothetical protein A2471_01895 [Omnitrophica WOR_2 bacterium RIFOXYC2_FULL_45_15]
MTSTLIYGILTGVGVVIVFLFMVLPVIILSHSKGLKNVEKNQQKTLVALFTYLWISYLVAVLFFYGVKFLELIVRHVDIGIQRFDALTDYSVYIVLIFCLISLGFLISISSRFCERKRQWIIAYLLGALGVFANIWLIWKMGKIIRSKIREAK